MTSTTARARASETAEPNRESALWLFGRISADTLCRCLVLLSSLLQSAVSLVQTRVIKLLSHSSGSTIGWNIPSILSSVGLEEVDLDEEGSPSPPGRSFSLDTSSSSLSDDEVEEEEEEQEDWWVSTLRRLQDNDPDLVELDLDAAVMYEEQLHRHGDDHEVSLQEDVHKLVDALQDNTTVTHLSLRNLTIATPAPIVALCRAIPQMTHLQLEDTRGLGLETIAKILVASSMQQQHKKIRIPLSLQHPALPPLDQPINLLPSLTELRLNHAPISLSVAKLLSQGLASTKLERLDFQGSHLEDASMIHLCKAMARNSSVEYWCLDFNAFGDRGVQALGYMLQHNTKLEELHLFGNNISSVGAEYLAQALPYNTTLQSLVLSLNDIGDDGVAALARGLTHNTTLTKLWMPSNNVSNIGLYAVADCMPYWYGLQELNVGDHFDVCGAQAIQMALQQSNYVLRQLYLESPGYICEQTEETIDFYLRANQCGRQPWLQRDDGAPTPSTTRTIAPLPASLYPHILAKTNAYQSATGSPDVLFYLLQQQPTVCLTNNTSANHRTSEE